MNHEMSQSIICNWLQVEDQLSEKLFQLTMLLHHFANSAEDKLPEVRQTKQIKTFPFCIISH